MWLETYLHWINNYKLKEYVQTSSQTKFDEIIVIWFSDKPRAVWFSARYIICPLYVWFMLRRLLFEWIWYLYALPYFCHPDDIIRSSSLAKKAILQGLSDISLIQLVILIRMSELSTFMTNILRADSSKHTGSFQTRFTWLFSSAHAMQKQIMVLTSGVCRRNQVGGGSQ